MNNPVPSALPAIPLPQTQLTDHFSLPEIEKLAGVLRKCISAPHERLGPMQQAIMMSSDQGRLALAYDYGRESIVRWFEETLKVEKDRQANPPQGSA